MSLPDRTLTSERWQATTGKGVVAVVLDSGVAPQHPALSGRIRSCWRVELNESSSPHLVEEPLTEAKDAFGHGTAVCGLLTEEAVGVEIVSVRVLDVYNKGYERALLTALEWALDQGYRLINLSLSTTRERYLRQLFKLAERAYAEGVHLVAAHRNDRRTGYPASLSSVVGVAQARQLHFRRRGLIEVAAYGEALRAPAPPDGWAQVTGSSYATPRVTALLARMLELYPELHPAEAKAWLAQLAEQ